MCPIWHVRAERVKYTRFAFTVVFLELKKNVHKILENFFEMNLLYLSEFFLYSIKICICKYLISYK